MTLTEQQRDYIVQAIVDSINDSQVSDEYSFGQELDIVWSDKKQAYRMLPAAEKPSWASPGDICLWIDDLSNQALIEWYCDDTGYPQEEITNYLEDEIALRAAE